MKNNIEVRDMVFEWLNKHGYDGLCNEDCGCGIDDLMPCASWFADCEPAYKVHPPEGSEWCGETEWIYLPEKSDAKV